MHDALSPGERPAAIVLAKRGYRKSKELHLWVPRADDRNVVPAWKLSEHGPDASSVTHETQEGVNCACCAELLGDVLISGTLSKTPAGSKVDAAACQEIRDPANRKVLHTLCSSDTPGLGAFI